MRSRLKVEGVAELRAEWSAVGERARTLEVPLRDRATRKDLEAASARRFKRGLRRASSRAWTLEKARRGLDARVMRASGAAELALTKGQGEGAGALTFTAYNGELRWGVKRGRSSLFYLQVHAAGYSSKRGRVPARRVVVIDKTAREAISERVLTYVHHGRLTGPAS